MNNLQEITEILRLHPFSREAVAAGYIPVLSKLSTTTPEARAKMLVEDMAAIGFNWPIRSHAFTHDLVLFYYEIPETDFGKDSKEDAPESQKAHGIGLNWGSVIRLSKACEIGRRYFGLNWSIRFKKQLLNGKDHLAFIEEILWLNLWYGVTEPRYEAQPFLDIGCKKRVDWRFNSCGQKINLEVKYRPKDWMRHVDGPENNVVMTDYFYDVPAKFPAKRPDELNLVGVSSPAAIDRSMCERTELLLRQNPHIDGVIIWAQASAHGQHPFEIQSVNQKQLIETFFTYGDFEDAAHIASVMHLWRQRDERRSLRADEVPELLRKLSEDVVRARTTSSRNNESQSTVIDGKGP